MKDNKKKASECEDNEASYNEKDKGNKGKEKYNDKDYDNDCNNDSNDNSLVNILIDFIKDELLKSNIRYEIVKPILIYILYCKYIYIT